MPYGTLATDLPRLVQSIGRNGQGEADHKFWRASAAVLCSEPFAWAKLCHPTLVYSSRLAYSGRMAGSEATNHRRDWNYQGRVGIAESTAAAGDGRKKTPRQPPDGGEGAQAPWQHTPPPPRHQWPPRKPVHSWVGIGWIILVLLIIGLWAGKLA